MARGSVRRTAARARDLTFTTLRIEQDGRVLTAYYESPPLNFVTPTFLRELDELTRVVDRDASVGTVVLASEVDGRFMTHADTGVLGAMFTMPLPEVPPTLIYPLLVVMKTALRIPGLPAVAERFGPWGVGLVWGYRWKRTLMRMNRSGAVYIAEISGPTLGGGHEIVLACDLRYVSDDPRIRLGQPEILLGIIPGGGGTQRLPRLIGTARALELILEGNLITADQALDLGLVHRVVAADNLRQETHATATRLATRSRTAVAAAKRETYAATDRPLRRGLERELATFLSTGTTADTRRAFEEFADDVDRTGDTPFVSDSGPWLDGTRVRQDSPRHGHQLSDASA